MRIVVVGDSDFASNAAAGIQGNADLFVNMNNWLTQQEDLISIHPRDAGRSAHDDDGGSAAAAAVVVAAVHSGPHSGLGRLHLVAEAINGTHWLDADPAGCRARFGRLPLLRRIGTPCRGREREGKGLHLRRGQDQSGPDQIQQRRGDRPSQGRQRYVDDRSAGRGAGRPQQRQRRRHEPGEPRGRLGWSTRMPPT